MNDVTRVERQLPGILADLGAGRPPDYTDTLLARTAATRQRPGWVFPERWFAMSSITQSMTTASRVPWRAIAVIALVVLALLAAALYAGSQPRRLPAPFGPAANGDIPYTTNGDLFLGNPVTGDTRLLVGGVEADALPQFSPDGTRVAFIRDVGTTSIKPIDIYVAGADGSGATRITPEPIWTWQWITWTPDGRGVAVVWKVDAGTSRIDVFDAAGSGKVATIATATAIDTVLYRPPDGHEILFPASIDGVWGLYSADADGTGVRLLVPSTAPGNDDFWGGVTYSADGSQIYYTRPYKREYPNGTCCALWVANADGSDPHEFVRNEGTAWDGEPAVSPDGSRVAFWHTSGTAQVAVVKADGTGPVIKTGPALPGTAHWIWAPDSSKILMFPNDDSSKSAYLLDPAGGPWTTVPWTSDGDIDWQRIAGG